MHLLRERKISVEQCSIDEPLSHRDSIWIGTPQEVALRQSEGRPIAAELESIDEMIEEATQWALLCPISNVFEFDVDLYLGLIRGEQSE